MKLKDHVALITGGGGALGRAIALKMAEEGAAVIVADLNPDRAEKVVAELKPSGMKAMAVKVDVRDRQSIREMAESAIKYFSRVDILVNNAGGSARDKLSYFHEAEEETLDMVLDINLKGTIFCSRALIGQMIKNRRGKIINISSIIGIQGRAKCVDYSAAKGGIIAMTKSLAMEVGVYGINVNCVSPGKVPRPDEQVSDDFAERYSFLGRICKPDDVANLVAFLASKDASLITGQNYIIDGGRSLALKGD